jgi:hypothetical protein
MWKQHLNEALELGAAGTLSRGNGWWLVLFADLELASFFREYALDAGWAIMGSGKTFGVRPTL